MEFDSKNKSKLGGMLRLNSFEMQMVIKVG